ncbi:MAG: division/cell wall cluster transcriptional repressor MraZ [Parvibaculum sp.]|uniref:division/cell wall cluster transcriptional repressor MraZ n=1 Tax=Parvibaculum sp. TaxID=2024848 RepID=UPI0025EED315|nr:division/cell wall cluster transcriptional repressor MraZ [Parvibaculum sp.]MCE9650865.1 division/cell wall cluster transcriptional repressor MraZ [Parvibaculum sp.]
MESFRGRFTNKIDAKGRVSVPAKFRAIVIAQGLNGIICSPSFKGAYLEAGGPAYGAMLDQAINRLGMFTDAHDNLAAALYGESHDLSLDGDGRIVLPEELRAHAKITDEATFVGFGARFLIWEPKAYDAFRANALGDAKSLGDLLQPANAVTPPSPAGGGL